MAIFTKCLWCGVRTGSIFASVVTMLYCIFIFIIYVTSFRNIERGVKPSMTWAYYVHFILPAMIFIAAALVIRGIVDDRRNSRLLLMPFIVLMLIYIVLQLLAFIQVLLTIDITVAKLVALIQMCFCLFMDMCVISQFQELKDGRGTNAYIKRKKEPPVMYIGVTDRMTLPFSREGSDGAAMYTSNRVPTPELNFEKTPIANNTIGSKSVEPTRRWTAIDYDYPIRSHSSVGGSYLGQQDGVSTHTESTYFFPINSGIDNNEEPESDNALVAPSAPSECGSFTPLGRALSYPSTPANDAYFSSTMTRRSMTDIGSSVRSLSHLDICNQRSSEYFGDKFLSPNPPRYHTISAVEKVESVV